MNNDAVFSVDYEIVDQNRIRQISNFESLLNINSNDCQHQIDYWKAGGFVSASLLSVYRHINNIHRNRPGYLDNIEGINRFMSENCNKFLHTVGVKLIKGEPIPKNYLELVLRDFERFRNSRYFDTSETIVDSAGYQIQCGYLSREETIRFIDIYNNEFLKNHHEVFDYAFLLDLVPGATESPFDTYDDLYKYGRLSYEKAAALPEHVRKKLLYIFHFRTPTFLRMYKDISFGDDGLMQYFYHFSTGGLVSFGRNRQFPVVMYAVPLCYVLQHAINRGLKSFRWHILGATEFKDILAHKFIKYHVKKLYDIDMDVTFDSSTIFKTLMLGRYLYVPLYEDRSIWKMFLRSDTLHTYWKNKGTVLDYLFALFNFIARRYGFRELDPSVDYIYEEDGRLNKIVYAYGLLYTLHLFNVCEKWCDDYVYKLYPLYESGEIKEFDDNIEQIMFKFNCGRMAKIVDTRTFSMVNTLKLIETLDLDYCDYLIRAYMYMDENPELSTLSVCSF